MRAERKPAVLHLRTVRYLSHAGADAEMAYRTPQAIRADYEKDPILGTARWLVSAGRATGEELANDYLTAREEVREGQWRLLECTPAWEGNGTGDGFLAWSWEGQEGRRLIAVNYAGTQGQCYVRLPFPDLAGRAVRLKDLTGPAAYDRDGNDLTSGGLYLDMPAWGYNVFEVSTRT